MTDRLTAQEARELAEKIAAFDAMDFNALNQTLALAAAIVALVAAAPLHALADEIALSLAERAKGGG